MTSPLDSAIQRLGLFSRKAQSGESHSLGSEGGGVGVDVASRARSSFSRGTTPPAFKSPVDMALDLPLDPVPVLILDSPPGDEICCGYIGRDKARFCIQSVLSGSTHCGVQSHGKKAPVKAGYVYITCPANASGARVNAAYVEPSLDISVIPTVIRDDLSTTKAVAVWANIFSSLHEINAEDISAAQQAELLDRTQRSVSFLPVTPARFKKRSATSSPTAGGFTLDDVDLAHLKLSPNVSELDVTVSQWNGLVEEVEAHRAMHKRIRTEMDNNMEAIDLIDSKTGVLHAGQGPLPSSLRDLPATNVWGNIVSTVGTVRDMHTDVDRLLNDNNTYKRIVNDIRATMRIMETKQADLESTVADLRMVAEALYARLDDGMDVADAGREATGAGSLEYRVAALEAGGGVGDVDGDLLRELIEKVNILEADSTVSRVAGGGDIVRIGNRPFHSADEIAAWMTSLSIADGATDVWVDIISMLEMLPDVDQITDDKLDQMGRANKGGVATLTTGRVLMSFSTTVPGIFYTKRSKEYFSAITTYKSWDHNDGRGGLVPKIKKLLEKWYPQHLSRISRRLSGQPEALSLAKDLLYNTMSFWSDFTVWIEQFHGRLTHRARELKGGETRSERIEIENTRDAAITEAWNLILKIIDDIFQELAQRRTDGQIAMDEEDLVRQGATVLYNTLRAHKFMNELKTKNFERHPVMAPTFNGFLFLERASHGDIARLELRIASMERNNSALQGKVDKIGANAPPGGNKKNKNAKPNAEQEEA